MPARKLILEIPNTPPLDLARRRMDAVRDGTGRVLTAAGTVAATVVMVAPETYGYVALGTAGLTLSGLVTLRLGTPRGLAKATTTVLYLMPGVSLIGVLTTMRLTPGIPWWEGLGVLAWLTLTAFVRPARYARRCLSPVPPAPVDEEIPGAVVAEVLDDHPAAQWWAANASLETGPAPATALTDVRPLGPGAWQAVIRSTLPGRPVPKISIEHLSALADIPEDDINIGPLPGRGAQLRLLTIGKASAAATPEEIWAQQIAPKGMPGAVLTRVRVGRPGDRTPPPAVPARSFFNTDTPTDEEPRS